MSKPFLSAPKASLFAAGIFFLSLALIAVYNFWWPGIMLGIGLSIIVRQLLLKAWYDALLSFVVFGGVFITVYYNLSWWPVLFVVAGIYLLFRAFLNEKPDEITEEEEIQKELEEKGEPKD